MATKPTEEEVMAILRDGGSVRYFYLSGGVGVYSRDGTNVKETSYCPIEIFLKWQKDGTIWMSQDMPYDTHKSQEYRLTTS